MIEILFGDSEAASMKAAKNKAVAIKSDGPTAILGAGKKKSLQRENDEWMEGTSDVDGID